MDTIQAARLITQVICFSIFVLASLLSVRQYRKGLHASFRNISILCIILALAAMCDICSFLLSNSVVVDVLHILCLNSAYLFSNFILINRLQHFILNISMIRYLGPFMSFQTSVLFLASTIFLSMAVITPTPYWKQLEYYLNPTFVSVVIFQTLLVDTFMTIAASRTKPSHPQELDIRKESNPAELKLISARLFSLLGAEVILTIIGVAGLALSGDLDEMSPETDDWTEMLSDFSLSLRFVLEIAYQFELAEIVRYRMRINSLTRPQAPADECLESIALPPPKDHNQVQEGLEMRSVNISNLSSTPPPPLPSFPQSSIPTTVKNNTPILSEYSLAKEKKASNDSIPPSLADFHVSNNFNHSLRKSSVDGSPLGSMRHRDPDPAPSNRGSRRPSSQSFTMPSRETDQKPPSSRRNSSAMKTAGNRRRSSLAEPMSSNTRRRSSLAGPPVSIDPDTENEIMTELGFHLNVRRTSKTPSSSHHPSSSLNPSNATSAITSRETSINKSSNSNNSANSSNPIPSQSLPTQMENVMHEDNVIPSAESLNDGQMKKAASQIHTPKKLSKGDFYESNKNSHSVDFKKNSSSKSVSHGIAGLIASTADYLGSKRLSRQASNMTNAVTRESIPRDNTDEISDSLVISFDSVRSDSDSRTK